MTTTLPANRVFSFACFEGVRLLRKYRADFPDLPNLDLMRVIHSAVADAHALDLEASIELSAFIASDCPLEGHSFYQGCIEAVMHQYRPNWLSLMRRGRTRFIKQLPLDAQDIFEAAGLLATPPTENIVGWWDAMSGHARLTSDHSKVKQGRAAEMLTLDHERRELQEKGIHLEPEWPGLDDNFAGYDVGSYDRRYSRITNRMIEVKSTIASPMRFFVTRNEWRTAESARDAYIFHIWNMRSDPPQLHTRTVDDILPHIPSDNGKGQWETAIVPLALR